MIDWIEKFTKRLRVRGDINSEFESDAARRKAYENTFFRDRESALVLADILRREGLSSNTFVFGPDGRTDVTAAAYRDGRRAAALEILSTAGADMTALARALVFDDLTETQDERQDGNPAERSAGQSDAGLDE